MSFINYFPRFIRHPVKRFLNYLTSWYLRLEPIDGAESQDIFVAGYPKSGNTWLQNIIAELAYNVDASAIPDELLQELIPDVHFKRYFKRFRNEMIFKTHFLPKPQYQRVIYIVRDGRDVAVSYAHYRKALNQSISSIKDIIMGHKDVFPSAWDVHVESWLANPFGAELLVVKYEELLMDPEKEIMKIARFIGVDLEAKRLNELVYRTSFSVMQKKEKRSGWDGKRSWPSDRLFVRSGRAGSYLTEMSESEILLAKQKFGSVLSRLGYIDDE